MEVNGSPRLFQTASVTIGVVKSADKHRRIIAHLFPSLFGFARRSVDYRQPGQDYGKSVPEDVENSGRLLIWLRRHTGGGRVISQGTEYSGSVPGDGIYGTTTTSRLFQHPARNNVNNGGSFSVCYGREGTKLPAIANRVPWKIT
ncbi:unnamed protein product, partial [Heterotrigona itama]